MLIIYIFSPESFTGPDYSDLKTYKKESHVHLIQNIPTKGSVKSPLFSQNNFVLSNPSSLIRYLAKYYGNIFFGSPFDWKCAKQLDNNVLEAVVAGPFRNLFYLKVILARGSLEVWGKVREGADWNLYRGSLQYLEGYLSEHLKNILSCLRGLDCRRCKFLEYFSRRLFVDIPTFNLYKKGSK